MKLIIGLGNPGDRYKNTRHNVGFMVLDTLEFRISNSQLPISSASQRASIKLMLNNKFACYMLQTTSCILVKPNTFMNNSGFAVAKLASYYKIPANNIYVIHDDLDIKLGEYKIQKGVGPKLHYGVESVDKALGTNDYWRVRIGVDNRASEKNQRVKGEEYVLQSFRSDEKDKLNLVIKEVVDELVGILSVTV